MLIVLIKLVPLSQDEGILEQNFTVLVLLIPNTMYAAW